jgi:hypothetical protein
MSIHEELDRVEEGLRALEGAALALRSRLGTDLDAVRLAEDVTRCREDLARLRLHVRPAAQAPAQEVIMVFDADYDAALWAGGDLDAEGLGVPGRRAP